MGIKTHYQVTFLIFIQIFLKFFNVYLFLRDKERQSMSREGAEREGDIESEVGSRLQAFSTELEGGLELTNHELMI